jgi:hypothetical protein
VNDEQSATLKDMDSGEQQDLEAVRVIATILRGSRLA